MTNITFAPDSPRRSVRFEAKGNEKGQVKDPLDTSTSSRGLGGRLMREHVKDRDPLFYYEILSIVGVGSMGSVATVRKRDEVVGGSSRQNLVESFRRAEKFNQCFRIPVLGPLFRFCVEDVGIVSSRASRSSHHTDSDNSFNFFSSLTASKRDLFTESERTALSRESSVHSSHKQMTYAMKSIHLNRITDESFVQELKNEIALLREMDHPHIVRPIETFNHRYDMLGI
jgi:serine/threonine protein kinase